MNAKGEIVGVILSCLSESPIDFASSEPEPGPERPAFSRPPECVGFAIPVHRIERRVEEIIRYGRVRRSRFGLALAVPPEAFLRYLGLIERKGLLVKDVVPGGPAEAAGVRKHDVLVSMDGREGLELGDFEECTERIAPGGRVRLGILREGESREIELALGNDGPEQGGR